MSDEVVKRPDEEKCDTNAEESPRIQAVEDGGESTEPKKKFSVLKVKFGPEPSGDTNGEDSNESPPPSSPIKSPQTPDMYTTNEAIPMTIFYRSQHSHGQGGKQRPTLQQLRKGLENDKAEFTEEPAPLDDSKLEDGQDSIEIRNAKSAPKFGWIKGVLFGCLLNIWGVMLYLRLSWVVGQAGIALASVIVILSAVVTTMTTLSLSAVCTNGEVKGGGAYYLISRSLGPEFGGSIGIIFSVASAVATAMYVVGFAETVRDILRDNGSLMVDESNDIRIVGLITVVILLGITMIGLEWVVRAQMLLLIVLVISILNVLIGTFIGPQSVESRSRGFVGYQKEMFETNFAPGYKGESFFSVFSVFFPAATGILAGVNISGDLKDVHKAVPKGTLLAILISTLVYIMLAWFVGGCVEREALGFVQEVLQNTTNETLASCLEQECKYGLLNNFQVMEEVSGWGPIVTAGIFASTLSSALASLVGAPKAFQAVCKDQLFPYIDFFGVGYGPGNEPRRGYILAFFVAAAFIAIGDLNVIAPIISNFFLIVYALINYAVFAASLSRSPGWRPSFKYYNMWVSLLGAMLCIAMMFLINWWAALLTIFIVLMLYKYVDFTKPKVNWGSSAQAYTFVQALRYTRRLDGIGHHVKNFRPHCLVLTGHPQDRPNLTYVVSQITKNVSLMVYGNVVIKEHFETLPEDESDAKWMREHKMKAFRAVTTARSLREGVQSMIHLTGLGKMRPNTVVMGFKKNWTDKRYLSEVVDYLGVINDVFEHRYGLVILRMNDEQKKKFIVETVDESSSSDSDSIIDEDEYSKPKSFSVAKRSTKEERESLTSPDKTSEPTSESSPTPEVKIALKEKQSGTIDVWWLYDDGGLTVLLPYLLTLHRAWKKCKLRFFSANIRSKHEVNPQGLRMANLLKKFRFDASCVEQVEVNEPPSKESIDAFRRLPVKEELGEEPIKDQKVLRTIRIGELVRKHCSADTRLVVISIPVPVTDVTTPLMYMSWLEVMSADLPPVLLVRGNQTNVLTFYS
ncbi:solute carrier family 12 member 2-like [Stylophora pistillata]|uniref:Solute carrier family 12 member 2 n=1 Tax=Stylophora pistillata TaxID=50429 RepID=A0A2B4SPH4_STYPI|nr:solute carrier family 12 member 2-like [Stylophora pistillata]PFX30422.1 Solute carrier family 12 member 2 [Stylophora pistillata]